MTLSGTNPPAAPEASAVESAPRRHPRCLGWFSTTALALGGSNQSLFLIAALFAGQGDIPGQGSAAVPLLIVGLLLSYAAAPGWTELVLMSPNRVGGIAAVCTAAFRPYSPILSALAGICYWWGWVPTCGVTAILSATAIHDWCLPEIPVPLMACAIVATFTAVNLCGIRWVVFFAKPVGIASATLAFISMIAPLASGQVDWAQAVDFHLTTPFPGWFGSVTSLMAGLYLIGFGAPAFEAAACHVGETIDPVRNVPRAMLAAAIMAAVYFAALPLIWLGALGPDALGQDLDKVLGPTFVPVLGSLAKSAAIGFMIFNMFHGTAQPLAGASRTLSQLAEDGLAPSILARRLRSTDAPWAATLLTAGFAILFLLIGDPIWLIAAANFTYLIGICLPSVAVWLLRRDAPDAARPYRAPRGTVGLGVFAAAAWGASALLGFEQFGLPTVVFGLLMAYSGAGFYALRKLEERSRHGLRGLGHSMHVKLTGAMLLVLALDAAGYILAVGAMPNGQDGFVVGLEDIFVAVAMLTITVGIVLPGMIAHSAEQVSAAAKRLAFGTVHDLANAMDALGAGDLEAAHASVDIVPVTVKSRDELGEMADSFNMLQQRVQQAALGLGRAREGLGTARAELLETNAMLARTVEEQERLAAELLRSKEVAVHEALHDPLTGLPNRIFFTERLDRALAEQKAPTDADPRGGICAVLFIDLDGFKVVNDSLGHWAGDDLLIQVANRLRTLLYSSGEDNAGRIVLARLGGDEFTVLLCGLGGTEGAVAMAMRITQALEAPFTVAGRDVHTSASIGIAATRGGYDSPADILRDADLAMYRAKALGKGRAEVYDASMHALATKRLHLENDLRRALREHEFVLHYQPIVTLPDEKIAGFEALVRWQFPGRGLVYPGDFIPVAEETGIIIPLGMWILREACLIARDWNREFGEPRPLTMSVNISPRQFAQHDLVRHIERVLTETGVDPALIKLEITESGTMGDPERAISVLSRLKALGVQLSVDDFGTGYSSLSYLHRFPVDVLKIDRSFVSGLIGNRESEEVVRTIMALAQGMGMQVIAEGIECREQARELGHLGCDFGQGYLYSRPVPEADIVAMLKARPVDELAPTPANDLALVEADEAGMELVRRPSLLQPATRSLHHRRPGALRARS
jgi:diguanylate cyclase (GGDEF)-like protein